MDAVKEKKSRYLSAALVIRKYLNCHNFRALNAVSLPSLIRELRKTTQIFRFLEDVRQEVQVRSFVTFVSRCIRCAEEADIVRCDMGKVCELRGLADDLGHPLPTLLTRIPQFFRFLDLLLMVEEYHLKFHDWPTLERLNAQFGNGSDSSASSLRSDFRELFPWLTGTSQPIFVVEDSDIGIQFTFEVLSLILKFWNFEVGELPDLDSTAKYPLGTVLAFRTPDEDLDDFWLGVALQNVHSLKGSVRMVYFDIQALHTGLGDAYRIHSFDAEDATTILGKVEMLVIPGRIPVFRLTKEEQKRVVRMAQEDLLAS
eukprot:ANDGO_08104.mRNA.1 hypothetical protein